MEQYISEIITALVSIGVSYGVIKTEINNMKQKLEKYDADHDLLVGISVKINMIMDSLGVDISKVKDK